MADDLWNEIQHMVLGRDDPELFVPYEAYESVLDKNRLSLLGRPLNPSLQNFRHVIQDMPRLWGLASRIHGRILDDQVVQFLFQSESDIVSVLRRGPWLYNNWFVALQRWEDFPNEEFLNHIDMWVQMRGIPLPYVSNNTALFIASSLGEVQELDFDENTSTQITFIRVKVRLGTTDRYRFFRRVRFQSGEGAMIGFEYENLTKICSRCCRINHLTNRCPYLPTSITPLDDSELQVVPTWNEGAGSNTIFNDANRRRGRGSTMSSCQPISQPPSPVIPGLYPNHHRRFYSSSASTQRGIRNARPFTNSENFSGTKSTNIYDDAECSHKRKKKINYTRASRNNQRQNRNRGLQFYPVSDDS